MLSKLCNKISKGHCTCFFDRFFGKDWSSCCEEHDEGYTKLKKGDSTKSSDDRFLECLKKKSFLPVAYLMYTFVRIFGRKFKSE